MAVASPSVILLRVGALPSNRLAGKWASLSFNSTTK